MTSTLPQRSYNLEEWSKGYDSQPHEDQYWIEDIEGTIPAELTGTLFRNGPGLLDIFGTPLQHPFDGDGMICSFAFKDGKAFFRNRYVKTKAYVEEQAAGKMLYRGVFGSQKPGGLLGNIFDVRVKNIANTGVLHWHDRLLALWEAAEPYALDPMTLETLGPDNLWNILGPGDAYAAHPWIDPSCDRADGKASLVNFAISPGLNTEITIYEIDPEGKLIHEQVRSVKGFAFIHDFIITTEYCIFFQNPVSFNPLPFLFGMKGAGQCVKFQPDQPTQVIIIPRHDRDKPMTTIKVDCGFIFHHGHAWQPNSNTIEVDSICYESLSQIDVEDSYKAIDFDRLSPGKLFRFTIDLTTGTIEKTLINGRTCEFPTLHPDKVGRDYQYLYIGAAHHPEGNAPLQAIVKVDVKDKSEQAFYTVAPHGYVSEPIFVPHSEGTAEDDGWVMTLVYNGQRHASELVILDAKDLSAIATLKLNRHIPYGLHGSWSDLCTQPQP
jgi:all-trans-8'-apo-beta-carotenal 15,15'-oxygenase